MWKFIFLRRNVVAVLAFLGYINVYMLRVNLSVAIVDMTMEHNISDSNGNITKLRYFDWDSKQRGNLLSSFFYGYIFTQLAGGWLGTKFGGATIFGTGIATTALLNLLSPFCARISIHAFTILRVIEGIFEGVTFPCIHAVWARWAPPEERTRLASFAYAGCYVGTVITFPACGMIIDSLGWEYTFYIPGVIGLIWYLTWLAYVKNNPKDDPYITDAELKYLQESLGEKKTNMIYPWKEFFTSMPIWAMIVSQCCENLGFYTLLTQLPSFLSGRFNFDVTQAGFLSALPYIVRSLTLITGGTIADMLRQKKIFTTTQVRKLFNCGAFINEAIFMTLTAFSHTPMMAVICLTMSVGIGGIANTGFAINPLDLAPQYASLLMGISNTFGTLSGIMGPNIAGYITTQGTELQWRIVFLLLAAVNVIGATFYGIFASGERQPWAMDYAKNTKLTTISRS